jgi:16S rRNA (cytosine1402-N4)-methyltransferase
MLEHISVMRDTCVDLLTPAINKSETPVVVDATLGLGGHSEALLESNPNLVLIGIDRDLDAIVKAKNRLAKFENRVKLNHAIFDEITDVVNSLGFEQVDGSRCFIDAAGSERSWFFLFPRCPP